MHWVRLRSSNRCRKEAVEVVDVVARLVLHEAAEEAAVQAVVACRKRV